MIRRTLTTLKSFLAAPAAKPAARTRLGMEAMESREVPSVTSASLGTSSYYGTKHVSLSSDANASNVTISQSGSNVTVSDSTNGFTRTYTTSQVQAVVFYGGGGSDRVVNNSPTTQLRAYGYAGGDYLEGYNAADVLDGGDGNDTLVGYGGDDTLTGGNGNDSLRGMTGNDDLFGNAGTDTLDGGGTAGDWLEAGSAAESATGGWNAHNPFVGGMSYADIDQGGMNNCSFLSSLASAVRTGQVTTANVSYLGNYVYRVRFYDPATHQAVTEDTVFNGTTVSHDPGTRNFESWTAIYNRAYFERFHGINYVSNPSAGTAFVGEHTDDAMERLMPYSYARFSNGGSEFTAARMQQILNDGWAMTACLDTYPGGALSAHAYMVTRVYTATGIDGITDTYVELYNPWASDVVHGGGRTASGRTVNVINNDNVSGLITLTWADFAAVTRYYAW